MKAFLTSRYISKEQGEILIRLLGGEKANHALFITSAAVPYGNDPRPIWLTESLADMESFAEQITETTLEDDDFIPNALDDYDLIFVSGGNTFYLAYRLHETGMAEKLKTYIKNDGVYAGSSAGSCILCDNLDPIKAADDPSLVPKIMPGLGLVDEAIVPHADSEKHKESVQEIISGYQNLNKEIIRIGNREVLIIDGESRMIQ